MTQNSSTWARLGSIVSIVLAGCAGSSPANPPSPPANEPLLKQLSSAGKDASLTILPVSLGGNLSKQVGEVIGLMLERSGMNNLEISDAKFSPPEKGDLEETSKALGEFVRANPPQTDFELFADFRVTEKHRFSEVWVIVADRKGEVVWKDRQTSSDSDFKRIKPREPMDCCMLVLDRLRPVLRLGEMKDESAPEGRLARLWREKSGTPDKAELAGLHDREQVFKKAASKGTLLIYPVHAGNKISKENAMQLSKLINESKLIHSSVAESGPEIAVDRNPNEQKTLWEMARAFREFAQKHPADADYVLYADYLMFNDKVGAVHFAICDRKGDLVIVDFQNDHHGDFNSIKPKSSADCDRLVVKRLKHYCR